MNQLSYPPCNILGFCFGRDTPSYFHNASCKISARFHLCSKLTDSHDGRRIDWIVGISDNDDVIKFLSGFKVPNELATAEQTQLTNNLNFVASLDAISSDPIPALRMERGQLMRFTIPIAIAGLIDETWNSSLGRRSITSKFGSPSVITAWSSIGVIVL